METRFRENEYSGGIKEMRSTGTPCSCPLCQGESYSRLAYEHETKRIIEESEM